MRPILALTLALLGCAAAPPRPPARAVRVSIGDGWATGYDDALGRGVAMLSATGWQWRLVARGQPADVTVEHADLGDDCARAGEYRAGDPSRVHADPVCAGPGLPAVVAHELLHWAGCRHVADPHAVLSPSAGVSEPACDPFAGVCVGAAYPDALSPADLAEFARARRAF
jgi:hypothetical protein